METLSLKHFGKYIITPLYQEILDAIHYSCMVIQDEIVEELEKKGQKVEFDKEVVAQVAFAICDTLCLTWPSELLQFAKHARRSVVNISDLMLLFRRNENMLLVIQNTVKSSLLPIRKRQSRNCAYQKNNKAVDCSEKIDNGDSKGALPFGNKDAVRLTDFWDQPSASRERPLLLYGTSSKYTSASAELRHLCNSIPQEKKVVTAEKTETVAYSEQKDVIGRKRQSRATRQSAFCISGSETGGKQLESVDINVPSHSKEKDLQERTNREMYDLDLSVRMLGESKEMNAQNTITSLKLGNEVFAEGSTAARADREITPHLGGDGTSRNKEESQIKSIFRAGTPALHSMNRMNRKQHIDTPSKNRSSAADDCFSSFKFESDDEDSDNSHSLVENKVGTVGNNMSATSPPASSDRCFANTLASVNNGQKEHQSVSSQGNDIDLDATIFDF